MAGPPLLFIPAEVSMPYITKDELESYVNKYPEDETLVEQYASAAQEMIENYLGYSPELKSYVSERYGDNGALFALAAYPLVSLDKVTADGEELDTSRFRIRSRNYLEYDYGRGLYSSEKLYRIEYTAGFEEVPKNIKDVALQLASLMWESEGGNLAVASTSYGDNGGRVYNNFSPDRFKKELDPYMLAQGGNF